MKTVTAPSEAHWLAAADESSRFDGRAVLAPEVMVAAVEDTLRCIEAVGVVNVEAVIAITPCVLRPPGSKLSFCKAQASESRPAGQQKPLKRQKDPAGHGSRDYQHDSSPRILQTPGGVLRSEVRCLTYMHCHPQRNKPHRPLEHNSVVMLRIAGRNLRRPFHSRDPSRPQASA